MYGSVANANIYFSTRLNTDVWDNALASYKTTSLIMATKIIDNLSYLGDKTVSTQELEFPRGTDITVPAEIEEATYEIALKLLEGFDPDLEFAQLGVVQSSLPMSKSTYDSTFTEDHLRSGVPSIVAWRLLTPYFSDPQELTLSRES